MIPQLLVTDDKKKARDYILKQTDTRQIIENEIIKEKDSITIDQIRLLRRELQIKQVICQRVIIWDFDTATIEAQNALLKVLEEKTISVNFYLHVKRVASILPTIRSRCTIIDLRSKETINYSEEVKTIIEELLADKQSFRSLNTPLLQPSDKSQAYDFLFQSILILKSTMRQNGRYATLLTKTLDLLSKIETNNLNPQLALDQWVLWVKRS